MTMPSFEEVDVALGAILAPQDDALRHAVEASERAGLPAIQVSAVLGRLLEVLVRTVSATTVLEVGTLGGYSTIHLARGLAPGGTVTTLELDEHHGDVARANLEYAGLSDRVEVLVGPALDSLERLGAAGFGPVDLVFIDADKTNNANYLRHALRLSRPGTLLIVDNVVRGGSVAIVPSPDESARGAREALELLASEPRIEATALQLVGTKGHDGFAIGVVTA